MAILCSSVTLPEVIEMIVRVAVLVATIPVTPGEDAGPPPTLER